MTALKQIRQMSLQEKPRVMEALWDDISGVEENLGMPQWHTDILDEREGQIAPGKTHFIDWEEAKKQIKEAIE